MLYRRHGLCYSMSYECPVCRKLLNSEFGLQSHLSKTNDELHNRARGHRPNVKPRTIKPKKIPRLRLKPVDSYKEHWLVNEKAMVDLQQKAREQRELIQTLENKVKELADKRPPDSPSGQATEPSAQIVKHVIEHQPMPLPEKSKPTVQQLSNQLDGSMADHDVINQCEDTSQRLDLFSKHVDKMYEGPPKKFLGLF